MTKGLGEAPEIALGELKVQYYPKAIKAPLPNQIRDPQSNKTFSVTGGISPEAGAHRLLMNQLARAMGFETPDCKLYVHDRYECSVLEESINALQKPNLSELSEDKKARLFLMASILGIWNITGACQAINGKLVVCDFSTAGLYANGRAKVDSQFTATPFELEWFRQPTAQTDTFPQCSPDMLAHFEKNKVLFQDLPEELIAEQADILSNLIIEELEQWTERLGPLKSIDRRHLYWVISERIAFLQRRFPAHLAAKPNCGLVQLKITPAAQRAIEASGISGHCLPATPGDIRKGELRLYTMLNRHNQPVTEAWGKLSPPACRRLSDNLGLPAPWHRRLEILDFYINQAFQKNCQDDVLRTMKMND